METDVLVIGAGVLGLSSAYYLKKRDPSRKVIVVERLSGPGQGNSAKSEGGYRNVFASEVNYLLADSTIDWFHHLQEDLEYDIGLHELGYLWLLPEDEYRQRREPFEACKRRGAKILEYSSEELKTLMPDLVTEFGDNEESDVMGLEDVTSFFHLGLAESARKNLLSQKGYPTVMQLSAQKPLVVPYIMGMAALPAGFDRVASIAAGAEKDTLVMTARNGKRALTKIALDFLRPAVEGAA